MTTTSTRDLIVEQADALFYQGGFEATSFARIAAAVGISRGNFYHHFKTKDDILEAVIARRLDRTQAMLDAWAHDAPDPRARITAFIRILITNRTKIMAFGCPVGTLSSELAKLDHIAQARAAQIFGLFRDWLAAQFQALGAGPRAQALALHVLAWSQGVAVMATAFRDPEFVAREVAGIEAWLALQTFPPSDKDAPCSSPS